MCNATVARSELGAVTNPRLFATGYPSPQLRLFELQACWARWGG